MHSSMEGGMDPSLITRPSECVPRTPWRILPLDSTAIQAHLLASSHIFRLYFQKTSFINNTSSTAPPTAEGFPVDPPTGVIAPITFAIENNVHHFCPRLRYDVINIIYQVSSDSTRKEERKRIQRLVNRTRYAYIVTLKRKKRKRELVSYHRQFNRAIVSTGHICWRRREGRGKTNSIYFVQNCQRAIITRSTRFASAARSLAVGARSKRVYVRAYSFIHRGPRWQEPPSFVE